VAPWLELSQAPGRGGSLARTFAGTWARWCVGARMRAQQTWPASTLAGTLVRMLVFTFANLKGGSGKTLLATNLASALHAAGHRIALIDVDQQGSSLAWRARASELGVEGPPCFATRASALRADLPGLVGSFDALVIDSPARLGAEARAAVLVADVVLVPIAPGAADLWAARETVAVIEEARSFRPELRARSVLNRADRTQLARLAERALADLGIEPLGVTIGSRVAFGEAMLAGEGVVTHAPKSEAAAEVRRLTRAVLAAVATERTVAA